MNVQNGVKGFVKQPLIDRFNAKFAISIDGCWIWIGSKGRKGYGQIYDNGKNRRATHVSWELKNGKKFPSGMCACHTCDTPECVNPDHIFIGTQKNNLCDCRDKGRLNKPLKTHCIRGHLMLGNNVGVKKNGGRVCKSCAAIRTMKYKKRKAIAAFDEFNNAKSEPTAPLLAQVSSTDGLGVARIAELEAELEKALWLATDKQIALAALRKRIADAPVVADVSSWWNGGTGFDLCNFKGKRPEPGAKLIIKEDLL